MATLDDAEVLAEIDYELFPENNFNERTIADQISSGACFLVECDGEISAYALCSDLKKPLVDVLRLGVRESHRRSGLGTVLLDNVLRTGNEVMLTVSKTNTPAINLYLKHEFQIAGMMPQHDCWVMRRPTTTSS